MTCIDFTVQVNFITVFIVSSAGIAAPAINNAGTRILTLFHYIFPLEIIYMNICNHAP